MMLCLGSPPAPAAAKRMIWYHLSRNAEERSRAAGDDRRDVSALRGYASDAWRFG
jgi:hypothetical protein